MTAAALALLLLLPAQEPPALEGCKRCDHRGVRDCERHPDLLRELDGTVILRDSLAARCPDCGGSLLVDCPKCDGGPESARREARRAELQAWLRIPHRVEQILGRPLHRIETPRFRLIVDVESLRAGRRKVEGPLFACVLARDLEATAQRLDADFGFAPEDYRSPMRMYFWGRREDHALVMEKFLFSSKTGDFKFLGKDPLFSVWTADPTFGNEAGAIHSLAVHNAPHMLISNAVFEQWFGDMGAGWLDAGPAHYYEELLFGRSVNYCVDETYEIPNWKDGIWRAALRRRLEREDAALLPALLRKQTGELRDDEHALCWSLFDWLAHEHPEVLRPFVEGAKRRKPARELFREGLGLDVAGAEEAWRAWVAESYPRKEPRRRSFGPPVPWD